MKSQCRALVFVLTLALLCAGRAFAVGEGRVVGTVLDAAGKPIVGATAILTRPGTDYRLEKTTDKKGQFTLLILDATQEYQLHLEKEGYLPTDGPLKANIQEVLRITLTLEKIPEPDPALVGAGKAVEAYNDGVKLLKGGDLAGSAVKFQEAIGHDPKLPEPHSALGEVYLELGKHAEALAATDKFLELRPNDVRGLRTRFDALKALGDEVKARAALEALAAVDASPDTAVRLTNEGITLFNAGDAKGSVSFFEKAVVADPNLAKAYYMLGLACANAGENDRARENLEKFLAMAPDDPDAAAAKEMLEFLKK
jgi:tetratricopeptide (TPR) repeat protein